jgi:hypothetical protein
MADSFASACLVRQTWPLSRVGSVADRLASGSSWLGGWILVWAITLPAGGSPAAASEMLNRAAAGLTADAAARHVRALADDAFEGREAGKPGGRAAAAYIVQQIERLGFEPAGDAGGYYQPFGTGMRNILALLPGRDPALAREVVIVGAHYDHVGYGNARNSFGPFGQVHNGADDNASGVAGLIEIMAALERLEERPRRSILVAFWDGEEKGLLGSRHFVRQRPAVLAGREPVFCLNLDMIGRLRDRRVIVYGGRTSPGLRSLLVATNNAPAAAGLELAFDWDIVEDSDHYSFISARVPTVMLHTGLHDQYHRPSDTMNTLNWDGIPQVSRLTLALALAVADAELKPAFRGESRTESNATKRRLEEALPPQGPSRGRWGIISRQDPCEPTAPIVISVAPGSPAERAGIRAGDRLLEVGGSGFADQAEMVARLKSSDSPCELCFERKGMVTRTLLRTEAE